MGLYDRDYVRDGNYRGDDGFPKPSQWSVVTWLIVINAAVLLIQMLYLSEERVGTVTRAEVFAGHIYLLLTYQFVHADLWHLGLNMLMLHFMGRPLLARIGPKQFLGLYLGAGVFGGLVQILYSPHPILGASAAVFGVLYGMISLTPWQEVYLLLFFVIPVRARMWKIGLWLGIFEIGMFVFQEVFGKTMGQHGIANLAHLGGAFFGWFWIAYLLPRFQRRGEEHVRRERWSERFGARKVIDAEVVENRNAEAPTPSKPKPFVSEEIDAILDKISAHGMQSLTDEEKRLLQQSSEKLARRVDGK